MNKNSIIDFDSEYNTWFDSTYYHMLYEDRGYNEAKKFVHTILNHLKLDKNSKILDAACGKGRHSIEIEKLGGAAGGHSDGGQPDTNRVDLRVLANHKNVMSTRRRSG